jgi:hypothetical protein
MTERVSVSDLVREGIDRVIRERMHGKPDGAQAGTGRDRGPCHDRDGRTLKRHGARVGLGDHDEGRH